MKRFVLFLWVMFFSSIAVMGCAAQEIMSGKAKGMAWVEIPSATTHYESSQSLINRARGADPEFYRLSSALRRIQASGAVGMRVDRVKDQELAVLTLAQEKVTEEIKKEQLVVRQILGLRQDLKEIRVVFGSAPRSDEEIAMVTRSMLEILFDLSASINVPPSHVEEGRTPGTRVFETDKPGGFRPLIRILSGSQCPGDAFVAIPYRGHWFWVEDRDYPSKVMFTFHASYECLEFVNS